MIYLNNYSAIPVEEREVLRYAAMTECDNSIQPVLDTAIFMAKETIQYKVCYQILPLKIENDLCNMGLFSVHSKGLSQNLLNCDKVCLFCATLGMPFEKLLSKYIHLSPSIAVFLNAIGAQQIESLCNRFCDDLRKKWNSCITSRFSPGYSDLPLKTQKTVFSLLQCSSKIGVYLTDSMLMIPEKSVTAFVGCKIH